jgi:hypothetical protein
MSIPKMPIHHTPGAARELEAAEHGAKPVCLGKVPKSKGYPIQIHSGTPGQNYDSNPANPLNSGPPISKRLTPVMPTPGMRSRTNENTVKPSLADESTRILNDASGARGSDFHDRTRFGK